MKKIKALCDFIESEKTWKNYRIIVAALGGAGLAAVAITGIYAVATGGLGELLGWVVSG